MSQKTNTQGKKKGAKNRQPTKPTGRVNRNQNKGNRNPNIQGPQNPQNAEQNTPNQQHPQNRNDQGGNQNRHPEGVQNRHRNRGHFNSGVPPRIQSAPPTNNMYGMYQPPTRHPQRGTFSRPNFNRGGGGYNRQHFHQGYNNNSGNRYNQHFTYYVNQQQYPPQQYYHNQQSGPQGHPQQRHMLPPQHQHPQHPQQRQSPQQLAQQAQQPQKPPQQPNQPNQAQQAQQQRPHPQQNRRHPQEMMRTPQQYGHPGQQMHNQNQRQMNMRQQRQTSDSRDTRRTGQPANFNPYGAYSGRFSVQAPQKAKKILAIVDPETNTQIKIEPVAESPIKKQQENVVELRKQANVFLKDERIEKAKVRVALEKERLEKLKAVIDLRIMEEEEWFETQRKRYLELQEKRRVEAEQKEKEEVFMKEEEERLRKEKEAEVKLKEEEKAALADDLLREFKLEEEKAAQQEEERLKAEKELMVAEARKRGAIRYTIEDMMALKDLPECRLIPDGLNEKVKSGFFRKGNLAAQGGRGGLRNSKSYDRFPRGGGKNRDFTYRNNYQRRGRRGGRFGPGGNASRETFESKGNVYHGAMRYGNRRPEGDMEKLTGNIKDILNKISQKLYDKLRDQFCKLDIKDDEGLNKIIEILFEYAVKFNDRSEMYAKLCADLYASPEFLNNYNYFKEEKKEDGTVESRLVMDMKEKATHFKLNLLAKCQKIFYSSLRTIEQRTLEEKETEPEAEKKEAEAEVVVEEKQNASLTHEEDKRKKRALALAEKKRLDDIQLVMQKRKDEVRGNMIFIASLYNQTGLLGKKIIVEVIKKTIFDIYGLKKGLNPKRDKIPEEKYDQIVNLCKFMASVGKNLDDQTLDVEREFQQKAKDLVKQLETQKAWSGGRPRHEIEKEISEFKKKGESVKRQLTSLYGFIRFLSSKEDLPKLYVCLAKDLLDLRKRKWEERNSKNSNQEVLNQILQSQAQRGGPRGRGRYQGGRGGGGYHNRGRQQGGYNRNQHPEDPYQNARHRRSPPPRRIMSYKEKQFRQMAKRGGPSSHRGDGGSPVKRNVLSNNTFGALDEASTPTDIKILKNPQRKNRHEVVIGGGRPEEVEKKRDVFEREMAKDRKAEEVEGEVTTPKPAKKAEEPKKEETREEKFKKEFLYFYESFLEDMDVEGCVEELKEKVFKDGAVEGWQMDIVQDLVWEVKRFKDVAVEDLIEVSNFVTNLMDMKVVRPDANLKKYFEFLGVLFNRESEFFYGENPNLLEKVLPVVLSQFFCKEFGDRGSSHIIRKEKLLEFFDGTMKVFVSDDKPSSTLLSKFFFGVLEYFKKKKEMGDMMSPTKEDEEGSAGLSDWDVMINLLRAVLKKEVFLGRFIHPSQMEEKIPMTLEKLEKMLKGYPAEVYSKIAENAEK